MRISNDMDRVCIIGAGASGLAAATNFARAGIPFDCLERESDLGGLWNAGTATGVVYDTTHLVSSRDCTGFEDFPIPDTEPIYPSHDRILAYLRDYATHHDLLRHIEFGADVEKAERVDGGWSVKLSREERPRFYRALVVASGHHDTPRAPEYPGEFSGQIMHSRDYRSARPFMDKRVLVIGAGNSACDIVVDATAFATRVLQCMRRGYFFVPKFMFGLPTDRVVQFFERVPAPFAVRNFLMTRVHKRFVGKNSRYGLPEPDYRILQSHPTMNTVLPQLVAHGRVIVKPEVERFDGSRVVFVDGSAEEADIVVMATGYTATTPFLDPNFLFAPNGRAKLFMNAFHPEYDDLFAVGLIQANGSIWRLADYQSQLIASYLLAIRNDSARADAFRRLKALPHDRAGKYVDSDRHKFEWNYYSYRRAIKKLLKRFAPLPVADAKVMSAADA